MKIYLGADHGGFQLKEEIKKWLTEWKYEFQDMGSFKFDPQDDYPMFSMQVADKVANEEKALGILACRSGQGVCMVANKAKGIRAATAWNEKSAKSARNDDDANILCLPSDFISLDEAKNMAHIFLNTPFAGEERFVRRVNKVKDIEKL